MFKFLQALKRNIRGLGLVVKNMLYNRISAPVVVLLYHRVAVLRNDPQKLAVSPENFENQIRFLKSHFPILRFEELGGNIRKPSIVITFDDGYADNLKYALPILEKYQIPATFFICTGNVERGIPFWWDELEHLITSGENVPPVFETTIFQTAQKWSTRNQEERNGLYQDLISLIVQGNVLRKTALLKAVRAWRGSGPAFPASNLPLSIEEVKRLSQSDIATLGAHTISHLALSALTMEEIRQEIVESKKVLESWCRKEISVFSYPFGRKKDYNQASVDLCKEAGFSKVASNFPGQYRLFDGDDFQIPRQLVRNWDGRTFRKNLRRFWLDEGCFTEYV